MACILLIYIALRLLKQQTSNIVKQALQEKKIKRGMRFRMNCKYIVRYRNTLLQNLITKNYIFLIDFDIVMKICFSIETLHGNTDDKAIS